MRTAIERERGLFAIAVGLGVPRAVAGPAFRACVQELADLQQRRRCDLRIEALMGGGRAPSEMGERLAALALDLGTAASRLSLGPARPAALRLLGLGPGSTPAGDDFLCGFLLALHCAVGSSGARQAFLDGLRDFLTARLPATCDLSANFLRCAMRALAPASLRDLAVALAAEHPGESLEALGRVCAAGHSSGADLATGFLYGLERGAGSAAGPSMSAQLRS
jgi:hypothetical protein